MRMRDGTILRADVIRPRTDDRVPVILMRNPYPAFVARMHLDHLRAVQDGFAVVAQSVRGTGASEGDFVPWKNEMSDGFEGVRVEGYDPASRRGHLKDDDVDEGIGLFRVHARDEDSLRGGNLTHSGIDDGVASRARRPRTNRLSMLTRREADFGSDGRGFESLRARHFLSVKSARRGRRLAEM
jgi:hypothetical protein